MKSLIRKFTPKWLLSFYHYSLALLSNLVYMMPSRKLIVIGITGTKGKTSASNYIWSVLQSGGIKTGILTTANIRIGEWEEDNSYHMTMPGRFFAQRMLRRMVKEGCEVAVVETTSQGIAQFRHLGIRYDVAIFTNLTAEHIESHGSFEAYKRAKGKMFEALTKYPRKLWKEREFPKTSVINLDSEHAGFYINFDADQIKTYSIEAESDFKANHVALLENGSTFEVQNTSYRTNLPGLFNVYNALPAIVAGKIFNVASANIQEGIEKVKRIAGRMEEIPTHRDFRVFVDYAHEPAGLQSVIEAGNAIKGKDSKTIVLIGAPGGGRDKAKRPLMGRAAGKYADIVIVSDDEPYDEDPNVILSAVKDGCIDAGKEEGRDLFVIGDRLLGIRKALSLAKEGDIVIFTGLGHQKVRMLKEGPASWSEAEVLKIEIAHLKKHA
ncbi:MAG TPA: UDP-N-acetylmuramyl-tripeptide synthetase [Candidatus Paceibacterota bacterium]|nr:UDP-N-acetylmuramyl-tripeptide synthetase [Candidatus Paceibacterota bacterium]